MNGGMDSTSKEPGKMVLPVYCYFSVASIFCVQIVNSPPNSNLKSQAVPVWAQDDLLKLLDSMKVNLPEKDLTKYKTTEAHLDWGKIAFNTYSAEMCKQKWLEVSREVRIVTR